MIGIRHHCVRVFWIVRNFIVRAKGSHYVYVDGCKCSSCRKEDVRCMRDSRED